MVHGLVSGVLVHERGRCKRGLRWRWLDERVVGLELMRLNAMVEVAHVHHGPGTRVHAAFACGQGQGSSQTHPQAKGRCVQVTGLGMVDGVGAAGCRGVIARRLVREGSE